MLLGRRGRISVRTRLCQPLEWRRKELAMGMRGVHHQQYHDHIHNNNNTTNTTITITTNNNHPFGRRDIRISFTDQQEPRREREDPSRPRPNRLSSDQPRYPQEMKSEVENPTERSQEKLKH